jgi:peptidoglycan/xylan/chitin deacetylase (PgdA/CDA1 family)
MKQLHDAGHVLGLHTWDHHPVTKYTDQDWKIQIDQPMKTLEAITGERPWYFAYPYGVYNKAATIQLENRGFRMAFILLNTPDQDRPLLSVRRLMVAGSWSAETLHSKMVSSFK